MSHGGHKAGNFGDLLRVSVKTLSERVPGGEGLAAPPLSGTRQDRPRRCFCSTLSRVPAGLLGKKMQTSLKVWEEKIKLFSCTDITVVQKILRKLPEWLSVGSLKWVTNWQVVQIRA